LLSYRYIDKNFQIVQPKKDQTELDATIDWNESVLKFSSGSSVSKSSDQKDKPKDHEFELDWTKIAGIWAFVRHSGKEAETRFILDVTITTGTKYHAGLSECFCSEDVEAIHFTADMSDACGAFLDYLEDDHFPGIVKQGRAPSWLVSYWCTFLYRWLGVSSHRLRVIDGWASAIIEVLFSICFLAASPTIVKKKWKSLYRQIEEVAVPQSNFEILCDLMMTLVYLRGMTSTIFNFPRSIRSIYSLIKKAEKSEKRLRKGLTPKQSTGNLDSEKKKS
jgi:hypothetical protein